VATLFFGEVLRNSMTNPDNDLKIVIYEPEDYIVIDLAPEVLDLTFLASQNYQQIEAEVIRLTNIERVNHGLSQLQTNQELSTSALLYSFDMAEHHFISHTGSDGSTLKDRILRAGYKNWFLIGENLAMGHLTPETVVQGWMASPGHRENILKKEFSEIGVGYILGDVYCEDGRIAQGGYWTQHFGSRFHRSGIFG
jgi:uncharacterized protein YkwD